jgi:hypothetical protein
VQYSGSCDLGETAAIAVRAGDGLVWVEVTDRRGPRSTGASSCACHAAQDPADAVTGPTVPSSGP